MEGRKTLRWASVLAALLAMCGAAHAAKTAAVGRPAVILPAGGVGADSNRTARIFQGKANTKGHPWMVSLWKFFDESGWGHYCGASVISSNWVLTAAQCVGDVAPDRLLVVYGNTNLKTEAFQTVDVQRTVVHPSYSLGNDTTPPSGVDLALVRLASPVKLRAMRLNIGRALEKSGVSVSLSGWGATKGPAPTDDPEVYVFPDELQETKMSIRPTGTCKKSLSHFDQTRSVCAGATNGETDACTGDSGGPLFRAGTKHDCQVGIASYGPTFSCNTAYKKKRVGTYTRISTVVPWIKSHGINVRTCQ